MYYSSISITFLAFHETECSHKFSYCYLVSRLQSFKADENDEALYVYDIGNNILNF